MRKINSSTYVILLLLVFLVPPVALSSLGIQLHTVTTGSMRPGIKPGAVVVTKLVKASEIKKGHVILYFDTETNNPVSHRVIAIGRDGNQISLTTKGDANAESDPTILEPSSVPIATVVAVLPSVGFVVSALHSTPFKWGFGLLIVLLLLASYLYERARKETQSWEETSPDEKRSAKAKRAPIEVVNPEPEINTEAELSPEEETSLNVKSNSKSKKKKKKKSKEKNKKQEKKKSKEKNKEMAIWA